MQALLDGVLLDLDSMLLEDPVRGSGEDDRTPRVREGVAADLAWLQGHVRVAAFSDTAIADDAQLEAALAPSGLTDLLDAVVTSGDAASSSTGEQAILEAAVARLGLPDPARVLVVGTEPSLADAAAAAGLPFLCGHPAEGERGADGLRLLLESWLDRTAGEEFEQARARVAKSDADAANAAATQQARLAKPLGSLGRLETLGTQLSAIAGACPPPVPDPAAVVVFAADHGIAEWDVSPRPRDETARLLATAAAGTSAVNVLARHVGARVLVVDVGVVTAADEPGVAGGRTGDPAPNDDVAVFHRSIRQGTGNLAAGPAMSRSEALLALDVGVELAAKAVAAGARCLVTGDIGVGSSTPAAALIASITNGEPADMTGRGSGADEEMLARKVQVVAAAIESLASASGPLRLLEQAGGFEIAALAGLIVGAAAEHVPVVVGGLAGYAALLVAVQLAPDAIDYVIAGQHQSDPAIDAVLEFLGLVPLLDLDVRLGQGAGALLAVPVVQAAARILDEMATVAEMA